MRGFHAHQRGAQIVARHRTDFFAQRIDIHCAAFARHGAVKHAGKTGDTADFGNEYVRAGFEQYFTAALRMREHGDKIGHGAAGHERARCLASALGGECFELHHGFVAIARIVAVARFAHRFEHGFSGAGNGVAA